MPGWVLQWLPAAVGVWWIYRHTGPFDAALVAVCCVVLPRRWVIGVAALGAALFWRHLGVYPLLGAALYGVVWVKGVRLVDRGATVFLPPRTPALRPRVRCRHGMARRMRRADRRLRLGAGAAAWELYANLLIEHAANKPGGLCEAVLCLHAAEAARAIGCADLAIALADAAGSGAGADPIGRRAVLVARAGAVKALAQCERGDLDEAEATVHAAVQVGQSDRATLLLIRDALIRIPVRRRRYHDVRAAFAAISEELAKHPGVFRGPKVANEAWQILDGAFADDVPADRVAALYARAAQESGVESWIPWLHLQLKPGRFAATGGWWVPWGMQRPMRVWIGAIRSYLEWVEKSGGEARPFSADQVATAVSMARAILEPETAARIALAAAYQYVDANPEDAAQPGKLVGTARGLFPVSSAHYADAGAWTRWLAIQERAAQAVQADAAVSSVNAGGVVLTWQGELLRTVAARADRAVYRFEALARIDPSVFEPFHRNAIAAKELLVAAAEGRAAVRPAPRAAQPVAEPAAVKVSTQPTWLRAAEDHFDGPVWILAQALREARELGSERVGEEHLLLAAALDPEVSFLLRPFRVDAAGIRAFLSSTFAARSPAANSEIVLAPSAWRAMENARDLTLGYGPPLFSSFRADAVMHVLLDRRDGMTAHVVTSLGMDVSEAAWRSRELIANRRRTERAEESADFWAAEIWSHYGTPCTLQAGEVLTRAVQHAQRENTYVDVDHLLLALRDRVSLQTIDEDDDDMSAIGPEVIRFTRRLHLVLAESAASAKRSGHRCVDADHLLAATVVGAPEMPGLVALPRSLGVERAIDAAHAVADDAATPYLGPEHLVESVRPSCRVQASRRGLRHVGLPCSPQTKRILDEAARLALAEASELVERRHLLRALAVPCHGSVALETLRASERARG